MRQRQGLWIRSETRPTERRAPITPEDAGRLVSLGFAVTVERSPQRIFLASSYAAAGCDIVRAGSWADADTDQYIVGLKELPASPGALAHRHLFFGHAYKGQEGATELLRRFHDGGGELLDMESLVDANGRRLAAFGYWAGYVGAALAVLHLRGQLTTPLRPMSKSALDSALSADVERESRTALVIGALGRCGKGARDALAQTGIAPTCWDIDETRNLDTRALLSHDILVNAVLRTEPGPPFLTTADLADEASHRLSIVSDVTCDVTSECNTLPIYDSPTTWDQPVRRLRSGVRSPGIIAIDNLPSLLPAEASRDFSAQLLPHLETLGSEDGVWRRCREAFRRACGEVGADGSLTGRHA
jgi:saccharopine dehydrogenase (NAD+, L-lysine-forming)